MQVHTNDSSNDKEGPFSSSIERILSSAEQRSNDGNSMSTKESKKGCLTESDLERLSQLCALQEDTRRKSSLMNDLGFSDVAIDLVSELVGYLEQDVVAASSRDFLQECQAMLLQYNHNKTFFDKWLQQQIRRKSTSTTNATNAVTNTNASAWKLLKLGLDAASILLFIMASPGIDRQVVNEEAIEACIVLMRFHISRHILPSVNQLPFPGLSDKPTTTTTTTPTTSAKKRRRSSSSNSNTSTIFKKVYPYVLETVGATVLLLERFDGLLQQVPLDDQELILIASGALQTLECDPSNAAISLCQQLHIATVTLLTRIFRNNPRLRPIILEDLFPLLIKVPTSKKTMHLWPLHQNHQHDTILHPSGLFASSNRQQRAPQTIQTVSALIMNLVQSCVVRPSTTTSTNIDTSTDTPPAPPYSSGLLHCQAACDLFLRNLLQRCRKKGPDGGASEYRPVLNHLLEDWLSVLKVACIAYPSAEILLLTVANYMSRELVVLSSEKKQSSVETTYLNTIFDALGKLCANQAHMLKVAREQPFPKAPLQPYPLEDKHVHCYCSEHKHTWLDKALMLNCDCCNTWYHGNCVGMNSRESVPEEWFCDACQMNRIMSYLQDQQKSNTSTNQIYDSPRPSQESLETGMTTTYAMQRLLMDYVRILVQKQESTQHHHQYEGEWKDAYEFHLARWMDQTTTNSTTMIPKWLEIWDAPTLENNNNKNNVNTDDLSSLSGMLQCLSEQGRIRIIMLLACHGLLKTFQRQVDWMVKFMAHDHSALYRKLSLKAIEKVTEADPTLMMYPFLRTAVTARFRDEAISVREAAVSLVGSYVVQSQSPTVANAFHTAFMVGLQDTGVSVRKRTIHILQNILLYNPNYKGRAQSCSELLKLAADPKEDDGVRDLIHDLFLKVWLDQGDQTVAASPSPLSKGNPKTPSMAHCCMEGLEGATLHTPPPPSQHKEILTPLTRETQSLERRSKTRRLQIRSEIAAEQMVQVIKASGDEGKNLTFLLKEIIGQAQDKYKTKFKSRRRKSSSSTSYMAQDHCTLLVDALLELLLSFEENRLLLSEPGKELAAIMRTIQVFTEVSPISVVPHLDTLLPYLKADNGLDSIQEEAVLVSSLSEIISRVSASLDEQDLDRIAQGGLGDDLVQVTYKLGRGALSSASQALCRLAHHPCRSLVFGQKVLYLANTFYKVLNKYKEIDNFSNQPAKIKANVHRALSVLGSICRYHETALLLEEDSLSTNIVLTWENLTGHCKHLFSLYLESKLDASTKCAALRALCGVFIAHPRILLEMNQMGIIGKVMASTAPLSLQLESLICWREILLAEESRIDSGQAKAKMDSKKSITLSKKISGDQDADATLFGGVLTSHAPRLLEITQTRDKTLRLASLDLIGHLLRQGQINPNETVPFLLALQGDVEQDDIRKLALKLLMIEGEKRPDMLRQRVCAGVKQAFKFQKAVYPDSERVSALVKVRKNSSSECVFGQVFKECIRGIKKQRQGLFRNLLRMFDLQNRKDQILRANGMNGQNSHKKSIDVVKAFLTDLPMLSFTSQVLAYLPYSAASDPLYIIHNITSTLALRGPDLLDRLAAFLRPYGLSSSDEFEESNIEEDDIERAAKRNVPRRDKEILRMTEANFDLNRFFELTCECAALTLLLRLKVFLCKAYNLSEARCLAYNPDEKDRFNDRAISKLSSMPIFDSSMGLKQENHLDGMIFQYSEFRQHMRAETLANESINLDDDDDEEDFDVFSEEEQQQRSEKTPKSNKKKRRLISSDE